MSAQDVMTYMHNKGRPDLFITFTGNLTKPQSKDNMFDSQTQPSPLGRGDVPHESQQADGSDK